MLDLMLTGVVCIVGGFGAWWAIKLIMREATGIPTEQEVREYEQEIQRQLARRPMGLASKTPKSAGHSTEEHHPRIDPRSGV